MPATSMKPRSCHCLKRSICAEEARSKYFADPVILRLGGVVLGGLDQIQGLVDELDMLPVAEVLIVGEPDVSVAVVDHIQRFDGLHATLREAGLSAAGLAVTASPTPPLGGSPAYSGASEYTSPESSGVRLQLRVEGSVFRLWSSVSGNGKLKSEVSRLKSHVSRLTTWVA
jgi:hypothetical protein